MRSRRTAGPAAAGRAAYRWSDRVSASPDARRMQRSRRARRPRSAASPVAGDENQQRRRDVLLRGGRGEEQRARSVRQRRQRRRRARAARAASPACCSSRATPAGPCPTRRPRTTARDRRRPRGPTSRRSSRRRTDGPDDCAPPARSRPPPVARPERGRPGCAPPASSSLSSLARATSVSLCSASSRSRSSRRLHRPLEQARVLDGGGRLQAKRAQELQLGGGVGHRQRARQRQHADDPLPHLQAAPR